MSEFVYMSKTVHDRSDYVVIIMVQKNDLTAQNDEQKLLKTTTITVRLPEELVIEIDRRAEKELRTRSNYIWKLIVDSWERTQDVDYTAMRKNFNGCIVENVEN